MKIVTIPVKGFWVVCREDSDIEEEFGASQFNEADDYLNEQRKLWPKKAIDMIADIDA